MNEENRESTGGQQPAQVPQQPPQSQTPPPPAPQPPVPPQPAAPQQPVSPQQYGQPQQYTPPQAPQQPIPPYQAPAPYTPPTTQLPGQPDPQQYGAPAPWMQTPQPAGQPRNGLSTGAWIGIIVGALVLVGAIVALVAFVIVPGLNNDDENAASDRTVSTVTPPPSPAPRPSPSPSPSPRPAPTPPAGDVLGLDQTAEFTAGPFWGVPFADGWSIVTFDQGGFNRFENTSLGCQFLTFQGSGDPNNPYSDDQMASVATLEVAMQIGLPWDLATSEPDVQIDGSYEVDSLSSLDAERVEMVRAYALYPTAQGDRERQMLIRAFMPANGVLYAEVDCPVGTSAADDIFEQLYVTDY